MVTTHIDRLMGGYLGYLNKKQARHHAAFPMSQMALYQKMHTLLTI